MTANQIAVKQLGYALGAEITGIDLRRPLDDSTKRQILDAWHSYLVVVFPGQALDLTQYLAFARQFGELEDNEYQSAYRDPKHPELVAMTNKRIGGKLSDTRNAGRSWHTDLAHTLRPAKAALLLCKEKPIVGGDTMFANMYLAYETLSPRMRDFLDTLEAIHDVSLSKGIEERDPAIVAEMRRRLPPVAQPVVRVHPDTQRKSLLIGQRIHRFMEMCDDESKVILDFLNAHATSPEYVYRHRWSLDDLVMWDNRCSMHMALPDFDQTQTRHMLRCSLAGEASGRLAHEEPAVQSAAM